MSYPPNTVMPIPGQPGMPQGANINITLGTQQPMMAPPPPPIMPLMIQQPQPMVIASPIIIGGGGMGPTIAVTHFPENVYCSRCLKVVTSNVSYSIGGKAILWICICIWAFGALFFWVPLIDPNCKDAAHTCPSCGASLGTVTS